MKQLSARNTLEGEVVSVTSGEAMATVKIRLGGDGQIITAAITRESATELGLAPGSSVYAVIKSTDVMLAVD